MITYGTNPGMGMPITGALPDSADPNILKALKYMGLRPGQKIKDIKLDTVFIGSCTNSRLEDLRMAARYVKGKHVAPNIRAMVVPGSTQVRRMAEEEGIADIARQNVNFAPAALRRTIDHELPRERVAAIAVPELELLEADELAELFGHPVDLVSLHPLLQPSVLAEARPVYAA